MWGMCVKSFEGLFFCCKSLGPIAIAAITSLEVMCFFWGELWVTLSNFIGEIEGFVTANEAHVYRFLILKKS